MALPVDAGTIEAVSLWLLLGAAGYSLVVLGASLGFRSATDRLRTRFLLGVPWGSLTVVLGVVCVYVFVQGGTRPGGPVVVGFRSWSYSYPLGMVFAPFAHSGQGHITGNLLTTVVFAPIAEYAWSHFPTRRGSHSFAGWRSNPFVRIAAFVFGVFLVGLLTSLFIPGALIGFSGVVFAFGGFALVTAPIAAVLGLVAERVVSLVYYTARNPVLFARGEEQFVTPFWADVAVQGHALGLLVGVLLAIGIVRRREDWPDPRSVWFAVLVFAATKALYALYWYLSATEYVLFRGLGLAALLFLAGLVAAAVARADRPIVPRIGVSRRRAATAILLCAVLAIAAVAVPYNAVSVSPGPAAEDGVSVRDYAVTYVEDAPNRYVAAVEVPFLSESLSVTTSGVIVASERRDAWELVVPAGRLAVRERVRVPVGGLGWRETVLVNRSTWSIVDGESTYKVFVTRSGSRPRQVFTADPVNASAIIDGRRIRIRPADPGYELVVRRNGSVLDTGRVPRVGQNVTVGAITFNKTGRSLRAIRNDTRVRIAREGQPDRRAGERAR